MANRITLRGSAVVGAALLAGFAAAPAAGAASTNNVLVNGSLSAPEVNDVTPTGWTESFFDNETAPFDTATDLNNASGSFPPPEPVPDASGFAPEIFYEAGSALGVEGDGLAQPVTGVDNTVDPMVGYSTVQTFAPATSVVDWAGSVVEIDFTSGGQSFELRYFNAFTPTSGTYASAPTDSATTKYITGATLANDVWATQAPRDLSADIQASFGVSSYTVSAVHFGVLEDTTSADSPFPNETAYFSDLSLDTNAPVGPPAATPEAPLTVGLPVAAVVIGGGVVWLRRRRAAKA